MGTNRNQQSPSRRALPRIAQRSLCCLVLILLCLCFVQLRAPYIDSPLVTQEIRYHMTEAGEVFLVWGINGWTAVAPERRPAGTVMKKGVMHTPMVHEGDTFIARVQVPAGATIDYGFLITQRQDGTAANIWEADGDRDYHTAAMRDGIIEIQTTMILTQDRALVSVTDVPLVTQEICYYMPEAGEVLLIWGSNGWAVVPDVIRPAGTLVKNGVMHTPMVRKGDTFCTQVRTAIEAAIDYGFLITKKRSGAEIAPVWDGDPTYHLTATRDGGIEVQTPLTLTHARELPRLLTVGLYLLIGIAILCGLGAVLMRIPRVHDYRSVSVALIGLMLLGLTLRLWVAGISKRLLDAPAQLIGDEPRYEELANALLRGDFFPQPTATPVYPLFLAGCYLVFGHSHPAAFYVQALVAAATIPLAYRLARRFIGKRGSLLAALLVALNPSLIAHVSYLYTEVLYTILLVLTLLGLLWALEAPLLRRFALAGILLGISTLCRSATAFLPLLVPLMLPRTWSLRRRIALSIVFAGAMVAVIAPWAYHNYRTQKAFIPFSLSMTMLWHGSPEFYHVMEQRQNAMVEVWNEELNPERNGGIYPVTVEGDRYFNARAIASIRAEPGVYVWYSLQKLVFFWIGHPAADYDWPFNFGALRTYFSAGEIASLFGGRLLLLTTALIGLIILRHRLRPLVPLLAACGYLTVFYAVFVAVARYSEPLYPVLAVIVAAAVGEVVHRRVGCRHRPERAAQTAQIASRATAS